MDSTRKCILIVEDQPNWQKTISDLLNDVANKAGLEIEVMLASSHAEASLRLEEVSYDCIIVDNKLPDGKMARTLIDRAKSLRYRVPVIVVSGEVQPNDVGDFFQDYEIDGFFWKKNFSPRRFKETATRLLTPAGVQKESGQNYVGGGKHMDWNTIIGLAVSAVSPYAATFALNAATTAGTKLGEAIFESIRGLWQWISQTISKSKDKSAEEVWKSFKNDPHNNKDALVGIIRQLSPDEDTTLRGYVQGLVQEIQLLKGVQLLSLLDNPNYYTPHDLRRICGRINPQWESEIPNPTQEALARWAVTYAPTRNRMQDLIAAMLEINPTVMLQ